MTYKPLSAQEHFEINQLIERCKRLQSTVLRTLSIESLDPCSICMESPKKNETTIEPCGHSFCHDCVMDWIQQSVYSVPTCPLCRTGINVEKLKAEPTSPLENPIHAPSAPLDDPSNIIPTAPPAEILDQRRPYPVPRPLQAWTTAMDSTDQSPSTLNGTQSDCPTWVQVIIAMMIFYFMFVVAVPLSGP